MFIEIEETVCFLASFLYGKIPRCRVDTFSEHLANALVGRCYGGRGQPHDDDRPLSLVVNVDGKGDPIVHKAAVDAMLNVDVTLRLLPNNLILEIRRGSVQALNAETGYARAVYPVETRRGGARNSRGSSHHARRRPLFRVDFTSRPGERALARPFFEIRRDDQVYTAQAFAATRFGSTKLKTYQGVDGGCGHHPFTMPSMFAYLKLLVFLNATACLSMLDQAENEAPVGDNDRRIDDLNEKMHEMAFDRGDGPKRAFSDGSEADSGIGVEHK